LWFEKEFKMDTEVESKLAVSSEIANDLRLMALVLRKKTVSKPSVVTCEDIVRHALKDREEAQCRGARA